MIFFFNIVWLACFDEFKIHLWLFIIQATVDDLDGIAIEDFFELVVFELVVTAFVNKI